MAQDGKARRELYDMLKEDGYYNGNFSEFSANIDKPQGRADLYNMLKDDGYFNGTWDEFNNNLTYRKKSLADTNADRAKANGVATQTQVKQAESGAQQAPMSEVDKIALEQQTGFSVRTPKMPTVKEMQQKAQRKTVNPLMYQSYQNKQKMAGVMPTKENTVSTMQQSQEHREWLDENSKADYQRQEEERVSQLKNSQEQLRELNNELTSLQSENETASVGENYESGADLYSRQQREKRIAEIKQRIADTQKSIFDLQGSQHDALSRNSDYLKKDIERLFTEETNRQGGALTRQYAHQYNPERTKDERLLGQAQKLVEEADLLKKRAYESMDGGTFIGGALRGIKDSVFDMSTWDNGMYDLLLNKDLNTIFDKYDDNQNGESIDQGVINSGVAKLKSGQQVSKAEEALMKAKLINLMSHQLYDENLGSGYKAGEVTGESLGFMLEMAINPASAGSKTTTSTVGRYLGKKIGTSYGKWATKGGILQKAANYAINNADKVVRSAGMAVTTGAPRTVGGMYERNTGELNAGLDDYGNIAYNGRERGDDYGTAFVKSLTDNVIQNATEMNVGLAGDMARGAKFVGGKVAATKPAQAIINAAKGTKIYQKMSDMVNSLTPTEFVKMVDNFEKRTQWHGMFEEYWEEVEGNILNALTVGDMNFGTGENGVFNLQQNIDTFLGVALMGGAISSVKALGYRGVGAEAKKRLDNADSEGLSVFGKDGWEYVKNELDGIDVNKTNENGVSDVSRYIIDRMQDGTFTEEGAKAVFDYLHAREFGKGAEIGKRNSDKESDESILGAVNEEIESGNVASTPEELRNVGMSIDNATEELLAVENGEQIKALVDRLVNDGVADGELTAAMDGMTDEQKEAVNNYLNAVPEVGKVENDVAEKVKSAVDEERARIEPYVDDEGKYRTAMYEGNEYIVSSSNGDYISLVNGESPILTSVDQLDKDEESNPMLYTHVYDEYIKQYEENLANQLYGEVEDKLNYDSRVVKGEDLTLGAKITLGGEDGSESQYQIIGQNEQTGTFQLAKLVPNNVEGQIVYEPSTNENDMFNADADRLVQMQNEYFSAESAPAETSGNAEGTVTTSGEAEGTVTTSGEAEGTETSGEAEGTVETSGDTLGTVADGIDVERQGQNAIPMDEEGEPVFDGAEEDDVVSYFNENLERNDAAEFLDAYVKSANEVLDDVNRNKPAGKGAPKASDYIGKLGAFARAKAEWQAQQEELNNEWLAQQDKAQQDVDRWKSIRNKWQQAQVDKENDARSLELFNNERATNDEKDSSLGDSQSLEEYVAREAYKYRYLWKDKKNGTKGLASYLFGKDDAGERAKRLAYLSNTDGVTPEEAAHDIAQHARENGMFGQEISEIDVLNMLIDAMRTHNNRGEVLKGIAERRFKNEEERARNEAEGGAEIGGGAVIGNEGSVVPETVEYEDVVADDMNRLNLQGRNAIDSATADNEAGKASENDAYRSAMESGAMGGMLDSESANDAIAAKNERDAMRDEEESALASDVLLGGRVDDATVSGKMGEKEAESAENSTKTVKREEKKSVDMSDEELLEKLKADGWDESMYGNEYTDEYDSRHTDEYLAMFDQQTEFLEKEGVSMEDAEEMKGGLENKLVRRGGFASDERTALSAQIDALEEYIGTLKAKERKSGIEKIKKSEVEDKSAEIERDKKALNDAREGLRNAIGTPNEAQMRAKLETELTYFGKKNGVQNEDLDDWVERELEAEIANMKTVSNVESSEEHPVEVSETAQSNAELTEEDIDAMDGLSENQKALAKDYVNGDRGFGATLAYGKAMQVSNAQRKSAENGGETKSNKSAEEKPKTERKKSEKKTEGKTTGEKRARKKKGADGSKEAVDDALNELKDVLKKFGKAGKNNGRLYVSLVGLTPEQLEMLGELFEAAAKFGYQVAKAGKRKLGEWTLTMKAMIGDALKDATGWEGKDADDFLKEVWDTKYLVDGKRKALSEHIADMDKVEKADPVEYAQTKANKAEHKKSKSPVGMQLDLFGNSEGEPQNTMLVEAPVVNETTKSQKSGENSTKTAKSEGESWRYSLDVTEDGAVIRRAKVMPDGVPVTDGRWKIEANSAEQLKGILENPANGLASLLDEPIEGYKSLGVKLGTAIVKNKLRRKPNEGSTKTEESADGYKVGDKVWLDGKKVEVAGINTDFGEKRLEIRVKTATMTTTRVVKPSEVSREPNVKDQSEIDRRISNGDRFVYTYTDSGKKMYEVQDAQTTMTINKEQYDYALAHGGKGMSKAEMKDRDDENEYQQLIKWYISQYPYKELDEVIDAIENTEETGARKEFVQRNLPKLKRYRELSLDSRRRLNMLTAGVEAYEKLAKAEAEMRNIIDGVNIGDIYVSNTSNMSFTVVGKDGFNIKGEFLTNSGKEIKNVNPFSLRRNFTKGENGDGFFGAPKKIVENKNTNDVAEHKEEGAVNGKNGVTLQSTENTSNNSKPKENDVRISTVGEGSARQQSDENGTLGEGSAKGNERTDGRAVDRRDGSHNSNDGKRGSGLSRTSESTGNEHVANPLNTRNNHAERGVDYAPKSPQARFKANVAAIKLMKQLVESGKEATPQQMEVLRKFSGWGGLGQFINNRAELDGILTDEEYDQAVMSINSAYYTPANVIDAMWDIARKLGFKGGNVLEGSAGIGNILGLMPTDMSERSNITAVEIDGTTGNILKLLYPDANVQIKGFESTKVDNASVDLAITNVPFVTGLHVMDTEGDKDLSKKFGNIHDFCIAKNVRKLRPGGIGVFISSSGTLDKSTELRKWVTTQGDADFISAFRLNNETFGGTGATSDIIIIRRRVNGKKSQYAQDLSSTDVMRSAEYDTGEMKTVRDPKTGRKVDVRDIRTIPLTFNSYFVEHPENMGGEMAFNFEKGVTRFPTSTSLFPLKGVQQNERLSAWVESIKEMDGTAEPMGNTAEMEAVASMNEKLGEGVKEGSLILDSKGNPCVARMGVAVPLEGKTIGNKVKGRSKAECIKMYDAIKGALAEVLDYQAKNTDDSGLEPLIKKLNAAYDKFTKIFGRLSKNTALSFLKNDVDFSSIAALEKVTETGDKEGNRIITIEKTDVFSKRVVGVVKEMQPKTVADAIVASIFKNGYIDTQYIADKLGMSEEEARKKVLADGHAFEDPLTGKVEVDYEYLSGNVRQKLADAQANNEDGRYNENIKALERVKPMDIPAHLIEFNIGSNWIEPKLFVDFVKEMTGKDVKLMKVGGTWSMGEGNEGGEKNKTYGVYSEVFRKTIWGTSLIEAAMRNTTISVTETHKHSDGTTETIKDKDATTAANNKVNEIRAEFREWAKAKMQSDPELAARIERKYNDMFNNYVPKSIPESYYRAHLDGSNHAITLYPHQSAAVTRAVAEPLLLAHEVGTGKTFTLISTAMEMRRLGTAKKPMIVVQNATVGQFVKDAKLLYPNAKVLSIEDSDRTAEGRKNFYAKIKYNDWDMIVVPQSVFERIPDSQKRQVAFIEAKIAEKMAILEQMKEDKANTGSMVLRQAQKEIDTLMDELLDLNTPEEYKKDKKGDKKREVAKQNASVKAQEMLDRAVDDVENFDDMDVDAILVDEAHEYKHLGFATAMQRGVKGVDPSYSKKSQGVYLKCQAVKEKNNGRNVVFATGTPISNTAAEVWTFMKYLMPEQTMKDYGIFYFDDFVRNFGNISMMLEFTTSGSFKENNRFAGYVNTPELIRIWNMITDTVLTEEAGKVSEKIPTLEGGKAQDIFLPQSKSLRAIMKSVRAELEAFEKMDGKQKAENSHIPLVMYGIASKAAIDPRLVWADAPDEPLSKTNRAVEETLATLEKTKDYKGTVAIFCDSYRNKLSGFNVYEEIKRKLVEKGVPAEQVFIMKSGMSVKKKQEIFDKVNAGEIRVILGSTQTLGTGVNIQERLNTLIHMDVPNRPMDYTQRNGRILRQGNLHKQWDMPVRVLRFGVEDSLDVTGYQRLKTKGAIADSIMKGKQMLVNNQENRSIEEEEDMFGDAVATLSGSEFAMLKNQAEREYKKFENKKKQWEADQVYIANTIRRCEGQNKTTEERIAEYERQIAEIGKRVPNGDKSPIEIGGKKYAGVAAMDEVFKEINKKQNERGNELKKQAEGGLSGKAKITNVVRVGELDFVFTTILSAENKFEGGKFVATIHRETTYTCDEIGLEDVPVSGGYVKNGVEDIMENVVTCADAKMRIERAKRSIEENNTLLDTVRKREGKPFEFDKELEEAKQKVEEYSELVQVEMAKKEAKYAEDDVEGVDLKAMDAEEDDAENGNEGDGVRFRRPSFVAGNGLGVYGNRQTTVQNDYYYEALKEIATNNVLFAKRMAIKSAAANAYKKFKGKKGGGKLAWEAVYAPVAEWRNESKENGATRRAVEEGTWNFDEKDAKELWGMIEKPLREYREVLVAFSHSQSKRFNYVYQTAIDEVDYAIKYYEALANGEDVFDEGWEKPRFARAWHGSAADFDRFNLDFALSGEGSMVNGHGVYVAELKGTAERYASIAYSGKEMKDVGNDIEGGASQALYNELKPTKENFEESKERAKSIALPYIDDSSVKELVDALDKLTWEKYQEKVKEYNLDNGKMLYEVEIPDDNGSNYLEWEGNDQRRNAAILESIKDDLRQAYYDRNNGVGDKRYLNYNFNEQYESALSDGEIYQFVSNILNDDKKASKFLKEHGFVGIKVPTGYNSGKTAEHNAYNYVVFDENDVKIVSKTAFRGAELVNMKHSNAEMDAMESAVKEVADTLNVPVKVVRSESEVDALEGLSTGNKEILKREGKGYYNTKSGEVVIYLANNEDAEDACASVLHEIVGHKGLRQLVGEKEYNRFLAKVYNDMPRSAREEVNRRAEKEFGWDIYEALDEKLAEMAEKDETPSWWNRVVSAFREMMRKLGMKIKLTENDLKYVLWQSKNQLKRGDIVGEAESRVMRSKLGIGRNTDAQRRNAENGDDQRRYAGNGGSIENSTKTAKSADAESESGVRFRKVEDKERIEWFDKQPKVVTYKTVAVDENGEMHAPMADNVSGTRSLKNKVKTGNYTFGDVLEAEEHPELADEKGKIKIQREDGKTLDVAYDPYDHSSDSMINDQFKSAWERDNLVVIRQEIPLSEVEGENRYHAEKALLPVGRHNWKKGVVGNKLNDADSRHVYLSRWSRPLGRVDWQEVADEWIEKCMRNGIDVPFNVVPRAIRDIIADAGVNIIAPEKGMGQNCFDAYEEWKNGRPTDPNGGGRNATFKKGRKKLNDIFAVDELSKKIYTAMQYQNLVNRFRAVYNSRPVTVVTSKNVEDVISKLGMTASEAEDVRNAVINKDSAGFYHPNSDNILIFAEQYIPVKEVLGTLFHENMHGLFQDGVFTQDFVDKFADKAKNKQDKLYQALKDAKDSNGDPVYTNDVNEDFFIRLMEYAMVNDNEYVVSQHLDNDGMNVIYNIYKELGYEQGRAGSNGILQQQKKTLSDNGGKVKEPQRSRRKANVVGNLDDGTDVVAKESGVAKAMYERTLQQGTYKFQEAWQDSMLGLKAAMKAVMKADGKKFEDVADWENAYMAENLMSSVNQAEFEVYRRVAFQPILEAVKKLEDDGASQEAVNYYLFAKHGLERNEFMTQQKVEQALTEEFAEELDSAQSKLDKGLIAYDEWEAIVDDVMMRKEDKRIELENDMKRDFSGLTALTGHTTDDDIADIEADAKEIVDNFEAEHGDLVDDLWDAINKATKSQLTKQYESGMMNREVYNELMSRYKYYIPLRGFDETTSDEVYDYLRHSQSPMNEPIKKANGRVSLADDPIATIGNMAESGIMAANRNLMKQKMLNFVENHRSDLFGVSDVHLMRQEDAFGNESWVAIGPAYLKTASDIEPTMRDFEVWFAKKMEEEPENYAMGKDKPNVPYRVLKQFMGEHQILVKRGGKQYVITVNGDPRVAQAVNGLTNPDSLKDLAKLISTGTNIMARLNTTFSPAFVMANLSRDGIYANSLVWAKESPAYAITFNKNWGISLANTGKLVMKFKKGTLDMNVPLEKMFYDFIKNGGETGQTRLTNVEQYKGVMQDALADMRRSKWNPKNIMMMAGSALEIMNQWAEDTTRFAAFMTSREMGRSVARSVYDAKEISVNFNKKGAGSTTKGEWEKGNRIHHAYSFIAQYSRPWFMFFNAGIQGMTNIGRVAKNNKGKFASIAFGYLGLGMLAPFIAAALGGDDGDDDYWNLPEYVRRQNLCLYVGSGYVKIPLPIELRAIYGMGDIFAGQALGKTRYKGSELAKQIAEQFGQIFPIDFVGEGGMSLVPSVARPVYEAFYSNEDWTGMPIYKNYDYLKYAPNWMKVYSKTDPTIVKFCELMNEVSGGNEYKKGGIDLNPAIIEHLYNGYLGGMGTFFSQSKRTFGQIFGDEDVNVRNIPIANRFYAHADERMPRRRIDNEWFRNKNEVEKFEKEYKAFENDTKLPDVVKSAEAKSMVSKLKNSNMYDKYLVWTEMKKSLKALTDAMEESGDMETDKQIYELKDEMNKYMSK